MKGIIALMILTTTSVFAQDDGNKVEAIFREDLGFYVFIDSSGYDAYSMVFPDSETNAIVHSFINENKIFIYVVSDYSDGKLDGVGRIQMRNVPSLSMDIDRPGWKTGGWRSNVSAYAKNGPYIIRGGDSLVVRVSSRPPPGVGTMEVSSSSFSASRGDPSMIVRIAADEFQIANGPKMYDVIAPRRVDEPATMERYLEALIPDIDTLGALGWASDYTVTDRGRSLTVRALADLEILGDSLGAREAMIEMRALAEAEKDRSLSPEAYSLLRYNAEYLLDRLPTPASAFERLSAVSLLRDQGHPLG